MDTLRTDRCNQTDPKSSSDVSSVGAEFDRNIINPRTDNPGTSHNADDDRAIIPKSGCANKATVILDRLSQNRREDAVVQIDMLADTSSVYQATMLENEVIMNSQQMDITISEEDPARRLQRPHISDSSQISSIERVQMASIPLPLQVMRFTFG